MFFRLKYFEISQRSEHLVDWQYLGGIQLNRYRAFSDTECKTDEILGLSLPVYFYQPGDYTENDGAGVGPLIGTHTLRHFSFPAGKMHS